MKAYLQLIMIHPSGSDVKPGGPPGVLLIHCTKTQHLYTYLHIHMFSFLEMHITCNVTPPSSAEIENKLHSRIYPQ